MSSSGDESNVAAFPCFEYDEIEKAVMESARGRWFLQEFAKRNRAADTQTLLEAIGRLQTTLGNATAASAQTPMAEVVSLAEVIKSTRSDIAAVRNDMLPDQGTITDGPAIYAKIAEHARTTASEIMTGTQRLQSLAGELKAANANQEQTAKLEDDAHSFQALAWSQDVLSQRIAKAMGLLSHVDDRIAALSMTPSQPIEPRHLKYFAPDESVFAPPAAKPARQRTPAMPQTDRAAAEPKGATVVVRRVKPEEVRAPAEPEPQAELQAPKPETQAAAAAAVEPPEPEKAATVDGETDKKRIVIIRRPRSETVEIPLATEMPERVA